jgi:hypothetical protein
MPQSRAGQFQREEVIALRVLGFGLLVDGDVGVGVFPESKEIFVSGERPDAGDIEATHGLGESSSAGIACGCSAT